MTLVTVKVQSLKTLITEKSDHMIASHDFLRGCSSAQDLTDFLPQVLLHSLAGVKKPLHTIMEPLKLSTDTMTNEIVFGGLAAP